MQYATPDWISITRDLGIVLAVIVAFVTAVVAVGKVLVLKPLERLIDEKTQQIQPHANGGKSLNDLHIKVDDLRHRVDDHITWHLEHQQDRRSGRVRTRHDDEEMM